MSCVGSSTDNLQGTSRQLSRSEGEDGVWCAVGHVEIPNRAFHAPGRISASLLSISRPYEGLGVAVDWEQMGGTEGLIDPFEEERRVWVEERETFDR
jgi:hypothetical protein